VVNVVVQVVATSTSCSRISARSPRLTFAAPVGLAVSVMVVVSSTSIITTLVEYIVVVRVMRLVGSGIYGTHVVVVWTTQAQVSCPRLRCLCCAASAELALRAQRERERGAYVYGHRRSKGSEAPERRTCPLIS